MSRKWLRCLAVFVLVAVPVFGCLAGQTTKDVLRVSTIQDPKDYHPYKRVSSQVMRINDHMFDRLLELGDKPNSYVPGIATAWEYVEDGNALKFTIREGVKFHNGAPMTIEDVVYSFKAASKETASSGGIDWLDWDGIKALDKKTLYMPFLYKNSIALGYLGTTNLYIVPQKVMEETGNRFGANPVGTGAFIFDKYVSGDYIQLKANPNYWRGVPAIKTIIYRFIPETSQAMIELETGGIDLVLDVSGKDTLRVEADPELKMVYGPSLINDLIYFNHSKPPFDNKLVRQAVAHAINKKALFRAVYQDVGIIAVGPFPRSVWAFDEELLKQDWYPFDVDKAKALLTEAGFPEGGNLTIEMYIDDRATRISASEVIKNMLSKIGINTNIHSSDYSTWFSILFDGELENIYMNGTNASTGEPDKFFYQIMHKKFAEKGQPNMMRWKNDRFSELLDQARTSTDDEFKKKCYIEAQRIFMEECPAIPYYERPHACAAVKNLQGVRPVGEVYDLKDCYFE
ncbi:MAG: ABC transporter substrate-binding protein [Planctomycetota bacterium]|jgi:peptide/nickel transport system substrate-binding protein|nr:ABC transporter substrate-binding protein [Planctomycetota bacterium]